MQVMGNSMLLYYAIKKVARKRGHHTAILASDQSITYSELAIQVEKTICYLIGQGIKPGDRIAVAAPNSIDLIYLYLAASRLNVIIIFLYDIVDVKPRELQSLLDHACPDWLLIGETARNGKKIEFDESRILYFSEMRTQEIKKINIPKTKSKASRHFIQPYTSGTTGKPKGVCLSEKSLYVQARTIAEKMQLDEASRVLLTGFLFNTTGLPLSAAVLLRGAMLVFRSCQDVKDIFSEVEEKRITHFMLQPYGIARALTDGKLSQRDLKSLRLIAYGAAPMPPAILRKIRTIVNCSWLQGYGLTESCGPITWLDENDHRSKPDSVGRVAAKTKIILVNEAGEELPPFGIGEIAIQGPTMMSGYWDMNSKQPTDDSFHQGWFRTGDLGFLDEEGYLYLKGRKKDCIVTSNGFTIYPKEVEDVIQQWEGIEEVAVVGLLHPSDNHEYPVAFIKMAQDIHHPAFKHFLVSNLSSLKLPHYIAKTSTPLPRNRNGKVDKLLLQEQALTLFKTNQLYSL